MTKWKLSSPPIDRPFLGLFYWRSQMQAKVLMASANLSKYQFATAKWDYSGHKWIPTRGGYSVFFTDLRGWIQLPTPPKPLDNIQVEEERT